MAKIMLVEDDNNLREIYQARLTAEGYETVTAADGEEALALAVKEKPDLIIADIMMPKISGFDMLDILRSTPEVKNTKIVMMTALSQAEDKARAGKLGADRYLVKSQVTLEDVVKTAKEVLEGKEASPGIDLPSAPGTMPAPSAPPSTSTTPAAPAPLPVTPAPTPAPTPAASNGTSIAIDSSGTLTQQTGAPPAIPVMPVTPVPVAPIPAPATPPPAASAPASPVQGTSVEDQIKSFIQQTNEPKTNAVKPATSAPTVDPLAESTPQQVTEPPKSEVPTHTKVIQPMHDLSKPDVSKLMAEAASTPSEATSADTIVAPDGSTSVASAEPLPAADAEPVSTNGAAAPPATPHPPGHVFLPQTPPAGANEDDTTPPVDPNSVAL